MRLKQRMNVLFPQPDGPMNAVTVFRWTSSETSWSATLPLYETARSLHREHLLAAFDLAAVEPAGDLGDTGAVDVGLRLHLRHSHHRLR